MTTVFEYVEVGAFVALLAAADVIVARVLRRSESGVLALAARLGKPTASTNVGGLAEQATATAHEIGPDALRNAILAAHGSENRVDVNPGLVDFVGEYAIAIEQHNRPQPRSRRESPDHAEPQSARARISPS